MDIAVDRGATPMSNVDYIVADFRFRGQTVEQLTR